MFYPAPRGHATFSSKIRGVSNLSDEKRLRNRRFGFFFFFLLSKNTSVMDQVRAWKQPFGFELSGGFRVQVYSPFIAAPPAATASVLPVPF